MTQGAVSWQQKKKELKANEERRGGGVKKVDVKPAKRNKKKIQSSLSFYLDTLN